MNIKAKVVILADRAHMDQIRRAIPAAAEYIAEWEKSGSECMVVLANGPGDIRFFCGPLGAAIQMVAPYPHAIRHTVSTPDYLPERLQ